MSEMVYIQDDYGNQIPLLDNHGNLSLQVIMLYAEDKLTEADRKTVTDFAATDEMSRDALEGFAMTTNASRTRHHLAEINEHIQKQTGAAAVAATVREKPQFDYRKMAAAAAALVVIGAGTFFVAQYFRKPQLADGTATQQDPDIIIRNEKQLTPQEEAMMMDEALAKYDSLETDADQQTEQPAPATKKQTEKASEQPKAEKKPTAPAGPEKTTETTTEVASAEREEVKPRHIEEQLSKNLLRTDPAASRPAGDSADMLTGAASANGSAAEPVLAQNKQKESLPPTPAQKVEEVASEAASEHLDVVALENAAADDEAERKKDSDRSARYPGGDMAMYKFIARKKNYTDAMKAQDLKGAVSVTFDIEPDGRVANAKVKSGANGLLNEDALRVVRSMPKWRPAQDANGENTRSSRTVVVKYGED